MRGLFSCSAIALAFCLATAQPASADFAYAIGDGGASLIRFSTDSPGSATRVGSFGAGLFLDAIDFRPGTGQLYGYNDRAASYYTVNLNTGALSKVSAIPVGATTNTFNLGMDFNPMIDRLRVVTDSGQNLVYNPTTGAGGGTAAAFTALAYAAGDVNAGKGPLIIDNAYTNNFAGATSTVQYVLDYDQNSLATLANNTGILSTVGKIRLNGSELDFSELAGFDILTTNGVLNTAYATLTVGGVAGLYTIDLANGNARSLGAIGSQFGNVYSLAVVPGAVPEPASVLMVAFGVAGIGLAALRRRKG